jgi:PPM family protein phosphatase
MLDITYGEATDPGKVRTNNEDSYFSYVPKSRQMARSHGWMFALSDGVGGMDRGEVASRLAVETLAKGFESAPENTSLAALMPRLAQHANAEIHNATLAADKRGGKMAATLVCCAFRNDQAVVAHVGDSRCYLVRDRKAECLTKDHTWVNEQRKLGLISATEAEESDARHILVRSLGPELFVTADSSTLRIQPGDTFVLCCDGLHNALSEKQIADMVSGGNGTQAEMQEIARRLVAYAVQEDGSDNTTAVVIRIRDVERVAMYRGQVYRLR